MEAGIQTSIKWPGTLGSHKEQTDSNSTIPFTKWGKTSDLGSLLTPHLLLSLCFRDLYKERVEAQAKGSLILHTLQVFGPSLGLHGGQGGLEHRVFSILGWRKGGAIYDHKRVLPAHERVVSTMVSTDISLEEIKNENVDLVSCSNPCPFICCWLWRHSFFFLPPSSLGNHVSSILPACLASAFWSFSSALSVHDMLFLNLPIHPKSINLLLMRWSSKTCTVLLPMSCLDFACWNVSLLSLASYRKMLHPYSIFIHFIYTSSLAPRKLCVAMQNFAVRLHFILLLLHIILKISFCFPFYPHHLFA